jgi:hypothetical protein
MDLARPSWLRAAVLLGITAAVALAPASAAEAHNGTGGSSSDYRITITGYDGDPSGVALRVIELGNRVELTRDGADVVYVLGYEGEQYLRLDADGVWENVDSPAHFLNADRFAATQPPADVTAASPPRWERVSAGATARWHDHRAHWMSTTPLQAVQDDPDVSRVVHTDRIDLVIDGRPVSAAIEVRWLPRPERINWLATASVLGAVVAGGLVLIPAVRRSLSLLAVGGSAAALIGQGGSAPRLVVASLILVAAVLAAAFRRRLPATIAAGAAAVLGITRLEVFEHELLAGPFAAVWQRAGITVAIGVGLGVVAAGLVAALAPTAPSAAPAGPDPHGDAAVPLGHTDARR